MPYIEKLKAVRDDKGLTNVDISKISGVPLATVTRVFNGQTPNPTFETISGIAIALGISLDEITGFRQADVPETTSLVENTINSYAELLNEKDNRIKELKTEKEREHKEKVWAVGILICFTAFILIVLTIDILHGHFGYFQY